MNKELGKGSEKQENSVFFFTAAVAGERAVWMRFSQYIDVFLLHNIPKETQQEEEEEMAASQVNVLSWVWGCVCFSS